MLRPPLFIAAALLAALPAPGLAQEDGCEVLGGVLLSVTDRDLPTERLVLSDSVHIGCAGGVELHADTAISISATGERRFIGNVVYNDSLKTLTADRVDYYASEERLLARGHVVLTDRESASVIRAPELEYFREGPGRLESRMLARGRPHATLYEVEPEAPAPGDTAAPPFEVDADSIEILGQSYFLAQGRAELVRGEMRGFGHRAEFYQTEERLVLTGAARVEGETFTLLAERIEAQIHGEALRSVQAERNAQLLAQEIRVDAPALDVFFEDGEVHRMVAIRQGAPHEPGVAADSVGPDRLPQPRAIAREFWLTADSIDALAPGQLLETVVAVGDAYGERIADSLAVGLPEIIAHDWLRGDTITAFFVTEPVDSAGPRAIDAAPDTAPDPVPTAEVGTEAEAESRSVLDRLVAVGADGGARSLYRMRDEDPDTEQPSVNYLVADRIVLVLRDGDVHDVTAEGSLNGMQLQPEPVAPTPPDSGRTGTPNGEPGENGTGR